MSSEILIFDTETTNLDFTKDPRIIEIGGIYIQGNPLKEEQKDIIYQRYNPLKEIFYESMAVHNIIDDDVKDCPPYTDFKFDENVKYLIGHNIDFDWEVIGKPNVKRIDTLALSRYVYPELETHKLAAVCYAITPKENRKFIQQICNTYHNALTDCYLALYLLKNILIKNKNILNWEQLYTLSQYSRIPKKITFGKYKGTLISELPLDYINWLLNQKDLDPYLCEALKVNLNERRN